MDSDYEATLFDEIAKELFVRRAGQVGLLKFYEAKDIANASYLKAAAFMEARKALCEKVRLDTTRLDWTELNPDKV